MRSNWNVPFWRNARLFKGSPSKRAFMISRLFVYTGARKLKKIFSNFFYLVFVFKIFTQKLRPVYSSLFFPSGYNIF